MAIMSSGDDPFLGWQGDGVDVEIERVNYLGQLRFRWSLYHQSRLVKTGMRSTAWGARLASSVARWRYRRSL